MKIVSNGVSVDILGKRGDPGKSAYQYAQESGYDKDESQFASDLAKIGSKQDKLTGNPGQLIGIGDSGAAQATVYPSNLNLLDNSRWDIKENIINQRGETQYTSTTAHYTIDRWVCSANASLTIVDGGIQVDNSLWMQQKTELSTAKMVGKKFTLSLLHNLGFDTVTFTVQDQIQDFTTSYGGKLRLQTINGYLAFTVYSSNINPIFIAAKLELGPAQTLAHKDGSTWVLNDPPPNYALELAKCQRYLVKPNPYGWTRLLASAYSENWIIFTVPISGTLRATPTIINPENMAIVGLHNATIQTGFTYAVDGYGPGYVTLLATKNAHGITDDMQLVFQSAKPVLFSAEL